MTVKNLPTTVPTGARRCTNAACEAGWHRNSTEDCRVAGARSLAGLALMSPAEELAEDLRALAGAPTLDVIEELWSVYGGTASDEVEDPTQIPDMIMHAVHDAAYDRLFDAMMASELGRRELMIHGSHPNINAALNLIDRVCNVGVQKTALEHPEYDELDQYAASPFSTSDQAQMRAAAEVKTILDEQDRQAAAARKLNDEMAAAQAKEQQKADARAARVDETLLRREEKLEAAAQAKPGLWARLFRR